MDSENTAAGDSKHSQEGRRKAWQGEGNGVILKPFKSTHWNEIVKKIHLQAKQLRKEENGLSEPWRCILFLIKGRCGSVRLCYS